MTTTAPSWLESWPSSFPDIEPAAINAWLRQLPRGLYDDSTTDEYKDHQATGVALSWVQQGSQWLRRRIFPQNDTGGLFLALWEAALSLSDGSALSNSTRRNRIIRALRYRGKTATKAITQAVFAPMLGFADEATRVGFSTYDETDMLALDSEADRRHAINSLHLYDSNTESFTDWTDGDCEAVGTAAWSESYVNATSYTKSVASPYAGSQSLRLTDTSGSGFGAVGAVAYQADIVASGVMRVISLAYRCSDTSITPKIFAGSHGMPDNTYALTASTSWTLVRVPVTGGSGGYVNIGATGGTGSEWIEFDAVQYSGLVGSDDRAALDGALETVKPGYQVWTGGLYKTGHWDTVGAWDECVWGD